MKVSKVFKAGHLYSVAENRALLQQLPNRVFTFADSRFNNVRFNREVELQYNMIINNGHVTHADIKILYPTCQLT